MKESSIIRKAVEILENVKIKARLDEPEISTHKGKISQWISSQICLWLPFIFPFQLTIQAQRQLQSPALVNYMDL
jgi:hypothetical protein